MRCFNRHGADAVGACKQCGKGLCPLCLTDLGHGLACKDLHEDDVQGINSLVMRNRQLTSVAPKAWFVVPTFTAFLGAVFLGSSLFTHGRGGVFSALMGAGFLTYAAVLFVVNYRAFKGVKSQLV
ncbi:hypothetical protein QLQ15_09335 [Lysobacter sp. LF1]|uniref:B box-type domain-containing protein n=1 Tax=Lysobacter stagni TaxID=3045172 RepID=A0ABT6XG38_9GAMM|nr:hypothetical protein [Lysobacter sp. LF1]MDI9239111.1 hypothetical protein [Lysobacter sp. LF1]